MGQVETTLELQELLQELREAQQKLAGLEKVQQALQTARSELDQARGQLAKLRLQPGRAELIRRLAESYRELQRANADLEAAVVKAAMAWVDMAKAQSSRPLLMPESQALIDAVEQLRAATAPDDEPAKETCGRCANWLRDAEPESSAGARPCGLDTEPNPCPRHPASACGRPGSYVAHPCASCDDEPDDCDYAWKLFHCGGCEQLKPLCEGADEHPDLCDDCVAALPVAETDPVPSSDEPVEQLPGVTLTDNLIRSEGDES